MFISLSYPRISVQKYEIKSENGKISRKALCFLKLIPLNKRKFPTHRQIELDYMKI